MKEPIQINFPTSTGWHEPKRDNGTVRYQGGLRNIKYNFKNGQVVFSIGYVTIRKLELRSVRSWRNLFQPRNVWTETQRFEDVSIYSSRESNQLFTSDKLTDIASKHINEGTYFDSDFLDWLLGPTEDRLNEILQEANTQITVGDNVVKLAA